MSQTKRERIRITLNVDRELYDHIKALSSTKGMPISRLFDEVFTTEVEKYRLSPLELQELELEKHLKHHEEFQKIKKSSPNFDPISYHDNQLKKLEEEHKNFLRELKKALEKHK